MRSIPATDAKARLAQLLDDVAHGETVVITRHGRPIARLVPEDTGREAAVLQAIARLRAFRRGKPRIPLDRLLAPRRAERA